MKNIKYIYRIAETNYGHEKETFIALSDWHAKKMFYQIKKTDWAELMLVGVYDTKTKIEKIYPYETSVPM